MYKICNHCKEEKGILCFGKDKHSRDLFNPKCKICTQKFQQKRKLEKRLYDQQYRIKNRAKLNARDKNRDKEKLRLCKLKKKFSLSKEDEDIMLQKQNYVCATCKKPEWVVVLGKVKRLAVDHSKKTGKVRGLLCNNCNRALGMIYENTEVLYSIIDYLKSRN